MIIIVFNLLSSVKKLHQANVIHRDLKSANILITEDCEVLLCDFGLARSVPESYTGVGSGSSKRVRDSILKKELKAKI